MMFYIWCIVEPGKSAAFVNPVFSRRRKNPVQKYDQPYVKKPPPPKNHHPEHAVLDNVNSDILNFPNMPSYRYDSTR